MTIFLFKNTPENRARADAISGIMKQKTALAKAETTLMKSKAALPWLLGCSALVLSAGVGGGVAQWGYSYITGNEVMARQTAEGVKAALADTTIKTDGTVTLAGDREVTLKTPAVVSLDPNSPLLRVSEQASEAAPEDAGPTWLTAYKLVNFGGGQVQSFASFRTSTAQKPFRQGCMYYEDVSDGLWRSVVLERNGQGIATPNPSPFPAVDLNAAATLCVQLTNLPTQAVAPVAPAAPVQTILIHAPKR